jgi:hypothetical protein
MLFRRKLRARTRIKRGADPHGQHPCPFRKRLLGLGRFLGGSFLGHGTFLGGRFSSAFGSSAFLGHRAFGGRFLGYGFFSHRFGVFGLGLLGGLLGAATGSQSQRGSRREGGICELLHANPLVMTSARRLPCAPWQEPLPAPGRPEPGTWQLQRMHRHPTRKPAHSLKPYKDFFI